MLINAVNPPPSPHPVRLVHLLSTSEYDWDNSVAADSTGVYLAGTSSVVRNTTATGVEGDLDTDAFVVKYNSTGGLLWERSWGTSEPDLGNGVAVDGGSGLVYVVGTTRGSMGADVLSLDTSNSQKSGSDREAEEISVLNAGASDVFLTCLGAQEGDIRWTVQFGSSDADVGIGVAVGPRGGVFLVGQLGDDDDPSLTSALAFLAKYDYLGNSQVRLECSGSSRRCGTSSLDVFDICRGGGILCGMSLLWYRKTL